MGEPAGSLDGVPVTIKDNVATKGQPVPLGAPASSSCPRPPMRRPRRAARGGAVISPRPRMPDYGMLSSGLSSFHP